MKAGLIVVALAVLGWHRMRGRGARSRREQLLVLLLGLATWTNWGFFHEDRSFAHHWDQYHYVMSSKYAEELGYDGLYVATALAAEQEGRHVPPRIRDLRAQRVVDYATVRGHQQDVRERFSSQRWREFKDDLRVFVLHPWVYMDHGYNAPPPLTAVLRVLTTTVPISLQTIRGFAAADMALLFGCVFVVWWAFGLERASQCALLLGISFFGRYFWNGGSILRYDWLFAITLAVSLLERRKMGWAGVALGYAGAVRIFPVFLAFPLIAWLVSRQRAIPSIANLGTFVAGMALSMTLLAGFGALNNGRDLMAYTDVANKLTVHDAAPPPNNIGMRTLLITSAANLNGDLVNEDSLYETNEVEDDYVALSDNRRRAIRAAGLVCILFALFSGAKATRSSAAMLAGLIAVFGLTALTCYYWMVLMLLPLWSKPRGFLIGLVSNGLMYLWGGIALFLPVLGIVARFNGALVFLPCAIIVLVSLFLCARDSWSEDEATP